MIKNFRRKNFRRFFVQTKIYSNSARTISTYCLRADMPERSIMEKFIIGAALGMAGGALLVANNCKLRNLVKKNQEELMQKAEQYIDKKLEEKQGGPEGEEL